MLGKVIATNDLGEALVATNWAGYHLVKQCDNHMLEVNDYICGLFEHRQKSEIEVTLLPVNSQNRSFKAERLSWYPEVKQAVMGLQKRSGATILQYSQAECGRL